MLKGYGKNRARQDSRLPITLSILQRLIEGSPPLTSSHYQRCQFKAMCSLAFFAFLRIGEITTTKSTNCQPLQLDNLAFSCDSNNLIVGIKLTFNDFKHNYNQRTLTIGRQHSCCPIQLLLDYLALWGNQRGAIFVTQGGRPVVREAFTLQLSEAIRLCGLDPARYTGHSFHIGAASYATGQGMSETPRYVSWVDGNRTCFISTFEFPPCLPKCVGLMTQWAFIIFHFGCQKAKYCMSLVFMVFSEKSPAGTTIICCR